MEERAKTFSPTRDRAFVFPSVLSSSTGPFTSASNVRRLIAKTWWTNIKSRLFS